MNEVGTDIGNVHKQRQGTGLATVLTGGEDQVKYAMLANRGREAKNSALAAEKKAALAKLSAYNPEYFYKHDQLLSGQINDVVESGARLINSGVTDPFSSQDPAAIEWRKNYLRVDQLATMSKGMKDEYVAMRQDIDKADPDSYDAQTLIDQEKYFNTDLNEVVSKGMLRPRLMKKTPYQETFTFVGSNLNEWEQGLNGQEPTDQEVLSFVRSLVTDPKNSNFAAPAYADKLAQMSEVEKEYVDARAKEMGVQPFVVMAFDDAKQWQNKKKPFNPLDELSSAADIVSSGVSTIAVSGPDGGYSVPNQGKIDKMTDFAAVSLFNSRPEWKSYYADKLPRGSEENDGQYAKRVISQIKKDMTPFVKANRSSSKTAEGKNKQETAASRSSWLEDIRGTDNRANNAAAQWLVGSNITSNLTVEWAQVMQDGADRTVEIQVTSPMSLREVEEQISDGGYSGATVSEVVGKQGVKLIKFPIGDNMVANQFLSGMYDATVKTRKENYDPKVSERTFQSADDVLKSTQQIPGQTKSGSMNF